MFTRIQINALTCASDRQNLAFVAYHNGDHASPNTDSFVSEWTAVFSCLIVADTFARVLLLLELIPLSFGAEVDNAVNSLRVHPNPQAYASQRDSGRNDKKLRDDAKPQCHPFGACEPCPKNLVCIFFCSPDGFR